MGNERVPRLGELEIKIFADGADLDSIGEAYEQGLVKGFTTNPSLMTKAGITNYMAFATEVLRVVTDLPVSFEVLSDDFESMRRQALRLHELADNVHVKIPITNTRGESACPLIHDLSHDGLKLNITAILSLDQVRTVVGALHPGSSTFVSVFAGRIADTGRDPLPLMKEALEVLRPLPAAELLWASPREPLNIIQAEQMRCHIITVTPEILARAKFHLSPEDVSLDTVKMFFQDALRGGFKIPDEES